MGGYQNLCLEKLHHVTLSHDKAETAETVGVIDLICLEHPEQSTSVTEIDAFMNLPVLTWA